MTRARWRRRLLGSAGFSLSELAVGMSVVGVLASIALPTAWTMLPAATARGGAREIQAALNQARMVAIQTRQNVCVRAVAGGLKLLQGTCAGTAWVGQDTSDSGVITLSSAAVPSGTWPVFTPFGTASTSGVLTVHDPSGSSVTVTVQPSGQVTTP